MAKPKYIFDYILRIEYACHCCGTLPPYLYTGNELNPEYLFLFGGFREIRIQYGAPIPLTGYRCKKHQMELWENKESDSPWSIHVFGLALDLNPPLAGVDRVVKIARSLPHNFRIGWKRYQDQGIALVHIDVGHLICPRYDPFLKEKFEW